MNFDNNRNPRRRKKRHPVGKISPKHKVIVSVILVVYVCILLAISFIMFYKPKNNSTRTFTGTDTDEYGNVITVNREYTVEKKGTFNFLVMGLDRAAMLTDVIMIVSLDTDTSQITTMQIPRDTYTSESTDSKANSLFSTYYNENLRNGDKEEKAYKNALADVSKTLHDSLCIEINYSMIMDLDGFVNIVDILGGVEINVPFDMYYSDPEQDLLINIPAGVQTLDGDKAEGFVRFRDSLLQGDLGRVNTQKIFLTALLNKVRNSISISNASTITKLSGEILSNLETDLSAADIVYFAKNIISCDLSSINMMTLPGNMEMSDAPNYYVMNRAGVIQTLNKYFNIFDKPITDAVFDNKSVFNNYSRASINQVYYSSADNLYDSAVYNAEDVKNNSIDVPYRY